LSRRLAGEVVSNEADPNDPSLSTQVVDTSGGHGTHFMTVSVKTLEEREQELYSDCICEVDGRSYPYGKDQSRTFEFLEHPDGTLLRLTWRGETATLWQYLNKALGQRSYLARLQRFCASGEPDSTRRFGRSFWMSVAFSLLAIGTFTLWFGWIGALLIAGVLLVHEFGHWLAMRMTGQPAPRIMLVPFFGGVAVANHPHKSRFDEAFCALMGPGFSVLPCLALLVTAMALGIPPDLSVWLVDGLVDPVETIRQSLALIALLLALVVGALNALQLLPVLPLDGGQVLRALTQSISTFWARRILLLLAAVGILGFGYLGEYLIACVLGLGALHAWHLRSETSEVRPMSKSGLLIICLGYGLAWIVHGGTVFYVIGLMGYEVI
jgi:Zn-dependent protease